jgi:hypothetical protein
MYKLDQLNIWRSNIFRWLDDPNNEPRISNTYIVESRVEQFIETMVGELKELRPRLMN